LPTEKLHQVGLDRETWQLEIVPDPASNCKVERPLSRELGTALNWQGLMKLAEKHAVRFLKVVTCTNMADPLGMGLWEGVPLREVIWLARPVANVRRVYYYGFHNDDPKQRFQSSLSIGRVLEDPPGELPVILCYKLNGRWLCVKSGGPVRTVVPEAYGNKSVKWLHRVVLTNSYQANDTYALWNNEVESPMKTYARFIDSPAKAKLDWPKVHGEKAFENRSIPPVLLMGADTAGLEPGLGLLTRSCRKSGGPPPVRRWLTPETCPRLGRHKSYRT
jgi:hypothetical protein